MSASIEGRTASKPPALALVLTAFAAVYVIWGSTYLGIRLAIETIPPLLMAGARFVIAGSAMYGFLRARGTPAPERKHWASAALVGGLLLLAGNGGLSWAEQLVPTGISALIVASVPLWIMLVEWLRPQGRRPTWVIAAGLAIGFGGVALIVAGRDEAGARMADPRGALVLVGGSFCWALGSVCARHVSKPGSALMFIALQMLAGGGLCVAGGLALGEGGQFHLAQITPASAMAFAYLTVMGSLVGFTAYAWLLQVSTPARVSTYAYVNPFIAVMLGTLVLHEPVPHAVLLAGGLILAAVILITRRQAK